MPPPWLGGPWQAGGPWPGCRVPGRLYTAGLAPPGISSLQQEEKNALVQAGLPVVASWLGVWGVCWGVRVLWCGCPCLGSCPMPELLEHPWGPPAGNRAPREHPEWSCPQQVPRGDAGSTPGRGSAPGLPPLALWDAQGGGASSIPLPPRLPRVNPPIPAPSRHRQQMWKGKELEIPSPNRGPAARALLFTTLQPPGRE